MSIPRPHNLPLEVQERAACMCDHGDVCSSFAPGHALHLIQSRLASATPSDWSVAPGSPVALHGRYNVLAVGRERFNILRG